MTTFKPVNIVINTRLVAGSDRSIPAPRISPMAGLPHGSMFSLYTTRPKICYMKQLSCSSACCRLFANENKALLVSRLSRIKTGSFKYDDKDSYEASKPKDVLERKDSINSDVLLDGKEGYNVGIPFLVMMAIAMGIAVTATLISIYQQPILGSSFVVRSLSESSSSSAVDPAAAGFSFKVFGYKIILPEYAPGWIYFWLLMAPGCGLFISEEVLNIWVGISLSRFLSLDGTWQSFAESFSRNGSYVISTVFWVYWNWQGEGLGDYEGGAKVWQSNRFCSTIFSWSKEPHCFSSGCYGYICRVIFCWSLLWWSIHTSPSAWNRFSFEGTPFVCRCNCDGNLDHFSICLGWINCVILLSPKALLHLVIELLRANHLVEDIVELKSCTIFSEMTKLKMANFIIIYYISITLIFFFLFSQL
ncbi:uncharacterized protein LOC129291406 isoform X1 [Prosopis cineraria]|uniref:uncharacterized protein LOC129291406 isoform X1 n=1 Tax=Prosopis cineraria TaxID=364024 RepID=UPI00240F073E|nr:uncharacterized protein LOC129291406 isoform X1 [Prosopis cineraria]